jgi:hypothetical protein
MLREAVRHGLALVLIALPYTPNKRKGVTEPTARDRLNLRDFCRSPEELYETCQIIPGNFAQEVVMNGLIYLVGLVVVIMAILSFFGLR